MEEIEEGRAPTARERFAAGVAEHGRAMFRAARSVLDSDAAAEDAVGQAVLLAWQALPRLRDERALRAWLLKITLNCAHQQRRRDGRVTYLEDLEGVAGAYEDKRYGELWEAVRALPEEYRAAVVLFYYEDMSVAEAARVLGVAQGTVKSRLSRARERLKRMLCEKEEL